jgi:hypothetical protein
MKQIKQHCLQGPNEINGDNLIYKIVKLADLSRLKKGISERQN